MSGFQKRLNEFLTSEDISMRAFERQCDIKAGTGSRMTEQSYRTTFHKIAQQYPKLNIEWLKTGEGSMLKPASEIDIDLKMGGHAQLALRDITNIGDAKARILLLQERIKSLKETHKVEIDGLNKQLTEKDARIDELKKMVDYLMNGK